MSSSYAVHAKPSVRVRSKGFQPSEVGKPCAEATATNSYNTRYLAQNSESNAWEDYTAESVGQPSLNRDALQQYLKYGRLSDHFVTARSGFRDEVDSVVSRHDGPEDADSQTTADDSVQIIVGNGNASDTTLKTCWSAADQSESPDQERYLSSLTDREPDWMAEGEEESKPEKSFTANLKRWQYRSPKTQMSIRHITHAQERQRHALQADKAKGNTSKLPATSKGAPKSTNQSLHEHPSKVMEDGEVVLADPQETVYDSMARTSNAQNAVLYVPPHLRHQTQAESHLSSLQAQSTVRHKSWPGPTPASGEGVPKSVKGKAHVVPHELRINKTTQAAMGTKSESASSSKEHGSSPNANGKQPSGQTGKGSSSSLEPTTPLPQRVSELRATSGKSERLLKANGHGKPSPSTPTGSRLGATFDIQSVLHQVSDKYGSRYHSQSVTDEDHAACSTPSSNGTAGTQLDPATKAGSATPALDINTTEAKQTVKVPISKLESEPTISPEWHQRRMFHDPAERKSVSQKFAEEQAQHLVEERSTVDMDAADFQAGLPILPEGEEDVLVEKLKDKQKPRVPEPDRTLRRPAALSKTSNERVRERIRIMEENPMMAMLGNPIEELRKLPKEEKARIRKLQQQCVQEKIDAPAADIYLRPAQDSDAQQICDIWNWHVENSAAAVSVIPDAPEFWRGEIRQDGVPELPFIVACLKRGKKAKVRIGDHIVGFGRALEVGAFDNAFRFSVELEVYVRDQSFHQGIGRCIFDRVMASVAGIPCQLKASAPFIGTNQPLKYQGGCFRNARIVTVSLLYTDNDPSYEWKKDFLVNKYEFKQVSHKPKIGYKLGQDIHMDEFHFETYKMIESHEMTRSAFQW